jgi:hypothetical protein
MMPKLCDILSLHAAFEDDDSYISFVENYVIPAIVRLVIGVGKDVLWKPMNHYVLLLTRDKRKIMRIAALKTLQKLFIEVMFYYLISLSCVNYSIYSYLGRRGVFDFIA